MPELSPHDIQSLQYLTLREVSNRLNLPLATVLRQIESGEIRAVKFDGQWRVRVVEKGMVRA